MFCQFLSILFTTYTYIIWKCRLIRFVTQIIKSFILFSSRNVILTIKNVIYARFYNTFRKSIKIHHQPLLATNWFIRRRFRSREYFFKQQQHEKRKGTFCMMNNHILTCGKRIVPHIYLVNGNKEWKWKKKEVFFKSRQ